MQLLPNGNYQITNRQTGEIREVSPDNLSKYGLSPQAATAQAGVPTAQGPQAPQAPQAQQLSGVQNFGQGVGSILKTLGLQALPNIAGAGYELYRGAKSALGDKGAYVNPQTGEVVQNPFLTEQDLQRIAQKPVETIARQTAGLAAYGLPTGAGVAGQAITGAARGALGVGAIPDTSAGQIAAGAAGGAVLEPVVQFLRTSGTYKVLGQQTQNLAQDATDRGVRFDWNDVLDKANNSKIAGTSAGKKAIAKVWSEFAPSEPSGLISPTDALNARSTIRDTYGSGLFQNIFQEPKSKLETKAAEVVREAISSQLHTAVPDMINPDSIVTWYNKGGLLSGDIPTKVRKAALAILGPSALKKGIQLLFYTNQ